MAIAFSELAGSPQEQYRLDGFRARRTFLVAWEDRHRFAAELLGTASGHGGSAWLPYPDRAGVYAVSVRFEPVDPQTLKPQTLSDPATDLNDYSGGFAKAVVEYRTVPPQDRPDGPAAPQGTHITYRMESDLDVLSLPGPGWYASDQPDTPLSADMVVERLVPVTEHRLTWRQVVGPPWQTIQQLQGKVNAATFLDCQPGTLLFVGAAANKLYRGSFEEGASPFSWEIAYRFRERAVKQGGSLWGWNHVYRTDPPGWVAIVNDQGPLYDADDFAPLFELQASI